MITWCHDKAYFEWINWQNECTFSFHMSAVPVEWHAEDIIEVSFETLEQIVIW